MDLEEFLILLVPMFITAVAVEDLLKAQDLELVELAEEEMESLRMQQIKKN